MTAAMRALLLVAGCLLMAIASTSAADANGHLESAQDLLLKAKEQLKQDKESMANQKKKLQDDLTKAMDNMKSLKKDNDDLRHALKEMEKELAEIREESLNPSVQELLDASMDNVNNYLHDLEQFDDVEALAADIEARVALVFGKEHSWTATIVIIAIVVFLPIFAAFYVLRRIIRLVSPSAYAATFAALMFAYVIAVEVVAIFTGSDPFGSFRSHSEFWYMTSQWGLACVGAAFLYITLSLIYSETVAAVRVLHFAQFVLFLATAVDYSSRVFTPSIQSATLAPMELHVLVLYVLSTASILLIAIRIESLKQNLKSALAEAASTAVFQAGDAPKSSTEGDEGQKLV